MAEETTSNGSVIPEIPAFNTENGGGVAATAPESIQPVKIEELSCTIGEKSSFTKLIKELRDMLAKHPGQKDICYGQEDKKLSSCKKHPLLAKPRADQQPARWIRIKLQVVKENETWSTTLVMRDDNAAVMGFINKNGHLYELGNQQQTIPTPEVKYTSKVLEWGNSYESILAAENTGLWRYPDVADGDNPRLAVVGLMFMVSESARMNHVHQAIARGWENGTGFTKQLMTDYECNYVEMSRCLTQWKQRDYTEPKPGAALRDIYLVLNVEFTMGDGSDVEMLDVESTGDGEQVWPGLPANSSANGALRILDAPAPAANPEAVPEIVMSEHLSYTIKDRKSFTEFIEDLREKLAGHSNPKVIHCDRHKDYSNLQRPPKKPPLLAKTHADEQPERWIELKLQVEEDKETTISTTLVIRDDNVDLIGFMNQNGDWYELGNQRMLPLPEYRSKLLADWVINTEQVVDTLMESSTMLGKDFAVRAVETLYRYREPEDVADGVVPWLELVGLSVMICDSARMHTVLKEIADGWDTGMTFTRQLMADTVGKYEWMSRSLWHWSIRGYAKPYPDISHIQTVCLVLNGPPEVVYTIGDEVSFISFIIDLRRMITNHPGHEDILDEHKDRNLSSTHEHPLLPKQHPKQPERWLHVKLQVADDKGNITSWTTLIMRDDNLYVHGFINKDGHVYGILEDEKDKTVMLLPNPYIDDVTVKSLPWDIKYNSMLDHKKKNNPMDKLEAAHLGRKFATDAVRVLSSHPEQVEGIEINAGLSLAGLILMFCESARMNPVHNAFASGWKNGRGLPEDLMNNHVLNKNYKNKSHNLLNWKNAKYKESKLLPHPIKQLQDIYLVLNTGINTKEVGGGGRGDGGPNQPGDADNNNNNNSAGNHSDSANQPGKAGDAGASGSSAFQPGNAGQDSSGSQPQDAQEDAQDQGQALVEILAIHADLPVDDMKIIVYDGIRGQIIYKKKDEGKHKKDEGKQSKEQKEQGEQQGMVELVLTGPYTGISAYGCFAIEIDITDDAGGSSTEDASGPIEWEWDCYDPKYAGQVDKPPTSHIISSRPGRMVQVTYAVMSNAREATVQVMLRLKDGHSLSEITARIDGFQDKDRSILFRCASGTAQCFSRTDNGSWFLLELARNVVAVPCDSTALHIEVKLQVETDDGEKVEVKVPLRFDNGICSSKTDDGDEVKVAVTWYPEIAWPIHPQEQRPSKAADEETFITPSEQSAPPEDKMVPEKYLTVVYTIGDEMSFTEFIMALRRIVADHPYREDILDGHDLLNLSSSREHPVLTKQRPRQPSRWLHIKLQVMEGKETPRTTTLVMRDDNLYVHGFINQQGVCYELLDPEQDASTNIIPSTYNPRPLHWGLSYKSILGTETSLDAVNKLANVHLGRNFVRKAVRRLSSSRHPDDEVTSMMSARLALAGLILMVCESARMNPLHNFFARGWSDGIRLTKELMDRYVWRYRDMSLELLAWKSGLYAKSHPIEELQAIYLVLNTMRIRPVNTDRHHRRWRLRIGGRDGDSSKKPSHRKGSGSHASRGGGKRKRACNDGTGVGMQSQRKKGCNVGIGGNPASKSEDPSDADTGGGRDTKSEEASDADSGGSTDSGGQSEESGDYYTGSPGGSDETGESGSSGGNNSGQPGEDEDAQGRGRPRVELLSMRADLGVIGKKIIVFDGKRVQVIYTKEEQGVQGGMVDLVLTGPYKGISAYGCFAIEIDIPQPAAECGDAGGSIQWEWDFSDPKYADQVDQPPVSHTICTTDDSRKQVAVVTYAVMSNAREATVQVKLRLKDGHWSGVVNGEITALIDGFKDRSVLFSGAKGTTAQCLSPTEDGSWFFPLQLSRKVVAVPCGSALYIEVNLLVATDDGDQVEVKVPLRFDNGICSSKTDDSKSVEVEVTWYPEIPPQSHPPEQITSKEADVEKFITAPSEQSEPPEVKTVPSEHVTVVYTIGVDELLFTDFIGSLRRILADHPDREDVLDEHPKASNLSSTTGEHPVLPKQRAEQPARWIHIKLQAKKGEEMMSTTLLMRDDNLYVCGFINQQGELFELIDNHNRSTDILPVNEYKARRLSWGVSCKSLLDAETEDDLVRILLPRENMGCDFMMQAMHVLSRFPAWVDDHMNPRSYGKQMNPRMALAGMIIMVCESARMNRIHNFVMASWWSGRYDREMTRNYVSNYYGWTSRELLTWKSKGYTNPHPMSGLQDIYLALNYRLEPPPQAGGAESSRRTQGTTPQWQPWMADIYLALNYCLEPPPQAGGAESSRRTQGTTPQWQPWMAKDHGRPRVEVLAMRADIGVVGTTVMVFDGKRGHIIYKDEQGKQGMADLVLTGPCKSISAYGCFAIKIDIPPGAAVGSSRKGDAGGSIKWEWDCYDQEYRKEVDKPPVTRTINRNVEVTYAVMSEAFEATVQVKMWLKNGNRTGSVHGDIKARIGDLKDRHKQPLEKKYYKEEIILFKRTKEMGQNFSPTDSRVLQLSRSVIAVPHRLLIKMDLQIETSSDNQQRLKPQPFNTTFEFKSGFWSQRRHEVDGNQVEVTVTWYPEVSSRRDDVSTEESQAILIESDVSYMIGDSGEGFSAFITELRRLIIDHPHRKDIDVLGQHPDPVLSSTRNHPVLPASGIGYRQETIRSRWLLHIKLHAGLGVETPPITLAMRPDTLDIVGFMNQKGHWYSIYRWGLPEEYKAQSLAWGRTYQRMLGVGSWKEIIDILNSKVLGKTFIADAVSSLSHYGSTQVKAGSNDPKLALVGLMVMVRESAKFNPVHDQIVRGWKDGTKLTNQLMDYVENWGEMSTALLDWKDHVYQGWPRNENLKKIKINSPDDVLDKIHLVCNNPAKRFAIIPIYWDY